MLALRCVGPSNAGPQLLGSDRDRVLVPGLLGQLQVQGSAKSVDEREERRESISSGEFGPTTKIQLTGGRIGGTRRTGDGGRETEAGRRKTEDGTRSPELYLEGRVDNAERATGPLLEDV